MPQTLTSTRVEKAEPLVAAYTGYVVYIYTYDIAYDLARRPLDRLLGQPVAQFTVDASKRSPKQLVFYSPEMVRLPPLERIGPHGPVRVERVCVNKESEGIEPPNGPW